MKQIDRIRNMNAEEMAEEAGTYFEKVVGEYTYPCRFCVARKHCNFNKPCKLAFKEWLESNVTCGLHFSKQVTVKQAI